MSRARFRYRLVIRMARQWYEIAESERPGYLLGRARELARKYGVSPENADELRAVQAALCIQWGWDPNKYIKDDKIDRQPVIV
jgi:hypothetical protein